MLNLKVGQKAKAIRNKTHDFFDGEIVEFVEVGTYWVEEGQSYVFQSGIVTQELIEGEFELI